MKKFVLILVLLLLTSPAYAKFRTDDLTVTGGITLGGVTETSWPSGTSQWTGATDIYFTSGTVGMGTSSPDYKVEISSDSAGTFALSQYTADAVSPIVYLRKSRGSEASPSAVSASDIVGQIDFQGYGSAGGFGTGARITAKAEPTGNGTWSSSGRSSQLLFYTVPTNSTTLTERLKIDQAGKFWFNEGTFTVASTGAITSATNFITQSGKGVGYVSDTDIYIPQDGSVTGTRINSRNAVAVIIDSDNSATTDAFTVRRNATTIASSTELFRVQDNGNVGIGSTAPSEILTIVGVMNITPQAGVPASADPGDLYVDSTATPDELCFYDGTGWQGISSGTDANCA